MPPEPICGNGEVEEGEQCDDGNTDSEDGCTNDCIREFCGDGEVQEYLNEECDEGSRNGAPTSTCDSQCRVVIWCGNSQVDEPLGEEVDVPTCKPEEEITCFTDEHCVFGAFGSSKSIIGYCQPAKSYCAANSALCLAHEDCDLGGGQRPCTEYPPGVCVLPNPPCTQQYPGDTVGDCALNYGSSVDWVCDNHIYDNLNESNNECLQECSFEIERIRIQEPYRQQALEDRLFDPREWGAAGGVSGGKDDVPTPADDIEAVVKVTCPQNDFDRLTLEGIEARFASRDLNNIYVTIQESVLEYERDIIEEIDDAEVKVGEYYVAKMSGWPNTWNDKEAIIANLVRNQKAVFELTVGTKFPPLRHDFAIRTCVWLWGPFAEIERDGITIPAAEYTHLYLRGNEGVPNYRRGGTLPNDYYVNPALSAAELIAQGIEWYSSGFHAIDPYRYFKLKYGEIVDLERHKSLLELFPKSPNQTMHDAVKSAANRFYNNWPSRIDSRCPGTVTFLADDQIIDLWEAVYTTSSPGGFARLLQDKSVVRSNLSAEIVVHESGHAEFGLDDESAFTEYRQPTYTYGAPNCEGAPDAYIPHGEANIPGCRAPGRFIPSHFSLMNYVPQRVNQFNLFGCMIGSVIIDGVPFESADELATTEMSCVMPQFECPVSGNAPESFCDFVMSSDSCAGCVDGTCAPDITSAGQDCRKRVGPTDWQYGTCSSEGVCELQEGWQCRYISDCKSHTIEYTCVDSCSTDHRCVLKQEGSSCTPRDSESTPFGRCDSQGQCIPDESVECRYYSDCGHLECADCTSEGKCQARNEGGECSKIVSSSRSFGFCSQMECQIDPEIECRLYDFGLIGGCEQYDNSCAACVGNKCQTANEGSPCASKDAFGNCSAGKCDTSTGHECNVAYDCLTQHGMDSVCLMDCQADSAGVRRCVAKPIGTECIIWSDSVRELGRCTAQGICQIDPEIECFENFHCSESSACVECTNNKCEAINESQECAIGGGFYDPPEQYGLCHDKVCEPQPEWECSPLISRSTCEGVNGLADECAQCFEHSCIPNPAVEGDPCRENDKFGDCSNGACDVSAGHQCNENSQCDGPTAADSQCNICSGEDQRRCGFAAEGAYCAKWLADEQRFERGACDGAGKCIFQ